MSMLATRFTELLGCSVPIQQAPMGSFAGPRLASAVANAGGHGMVTVTGYPPDALAARLEDALERTPGPIGANFFVAMADPRPCVIRSPRPRRAPGWSIYPERALVDLVHARRRARGDAALGLESVRRVRRRQTAAEVMAELVEEAERLLGRWGTPAG